MGSSSLLNLLFSPCFLLEAGSPPQVLSLPGLHPFPARPFSRPAPGRGGSTQSVPGKVDKPAELWRAIMIIGLECLPPYLLRHCPLLSPSSLPFLPPVRPRALGPIPLLSTPSSSRASFRSTLLSVPFSPPAPLPSPVPAGQEAPRAFRASRPLLLIQREKESHASLSDSILPPSPSRCTRTLYSTLFTYTAEFCHALECQRVLGAYFCLAHRRNNYRVLRPLFSICCT